MPVAVGIRDGVRVSWVGDMELGLGAGSGSGSGLGSGSVLIGVIAGRFTWVALPVSLGRPLT